MPSILRVPQGVARRAFAARSAIAVVGALLPALSLGAQQSPRPTAATLGFSEERLARIDSFLQRKVDRGEIGGAVALVLRDGKTVYERAVGWSDREAGRHMTTDAIFRIASQTKALTSVAIMSLVEEGKLALNDPVSRFIPEFERTTVAVRTDTGRAIVPARRRITIRDLLTHTAGISYGTDSLSAPLYVAQALGPTAGWGWYTADKNEPICRTIERLATLPFVAQPGERFVYDYNTDILGCVAERARILGPKTVALMTTNQTGTLYSQTGQGFGLGFHIVQQAGADGRVESPDTFGWGGAYGSTYSVDPKERLVCVLMVQLLPSRSDIGQTLPMVVYQAMVKPRAGEAAVSSRH